MQTFLKIKIKSLAAEARMIRLEELRLIGINYRSDPKARRTRIQGQLPWLRTHQEVPSAIEALEFRYNKLRVHRVHEVRREARAAQLAYGLLRGRRYAQVENLGSKPPVNIRGRVIDMVAKYGDCSKASAERQVDAWVLGTE